MQQSLNSQNKNRWQLSHAIQCMQARMAIWPAKPKASSQRSEIYIDECRRMPTSRKNRLYEEVYHGTKIIGVFQETWLRVRSHHVYMIPNMTRCISISASYECPHQQSVLLHDIVTSYINACTCMYASRYISSGQAEVQCHTQLQGSRLGPAGAVTHRKLASKAAGGDTTRAACTGSRLSIDDA